MSEKQTWFCAQIGKKDLYAVPRAFHSAGALNGFMTDFWAGTVTKGVTKGIAQLLPGTLWHAMGDRCHPDLPASRVKSWNLSACMWEIGLRRMARKRGMEGRYLGFCEVGRRFAQAVARSLKARRDLPDNTAFFGFDTTCLEVMEYLKSRGIRCFMNQSDPCQVEVETVQAEERAWPGWAKSPLVVPDEYFVRHRNEWAIADVVVVNSQFSRKGLLQQGVSETKLVVIPLSCPLSCDPHYIKEEASLEGPVSLQRKIPDGFTRENPLRILFLGQVMLRKGIQYLVQAAESLRDCPIVFDIVGSIYISAKAISSAPPNVTFHGRVIQNTITGWYRNSHVFVLPTISDGFAMTQAEAMANGLPVIATPNCGDVVTDGVDGYIVPPRDSHSLARAIRRYLEEPKCLEKQHRAALQKSKQFTLDRFRTNMLALGHP